MNQQKAMVRNNSTGAEIYFTDDSYGSAYKKAEKFFNKNKGYNLFHHCTLPYAFVGIDRWKLIKEAV